MSIYHVGKVYKCIPLHIDLCNIVLKYRAHQCLKCNKVMINYKAEMCGVCYQENIKNMYLKGLIQISEYFNLIAGNLFTD